MTPVLPSTYRRLVARISDEIFFLLLAAPYYFEFIKSAIKTGYIHIHWMDLCGFLLLKFLYEFLSYFFWGATPGKMLFRLSVVDSKNWKSPLVIEQALIRVLSSKLSFFFGWALYATAFFKLDRTHLCDWVAGTRVVQWTETSRIPQVRNGLAVVLILFFSIKNLISSEEILKHIQFTQGYYKIQTQVAIDDEWEDLFED